MLGVSRILFECLIGFQLIFHCLTFLLDYCDKPKHFIRSTVKRLPIADFIQPTKNQCPEKNHILGDAFTKFAVCVNIYTNPELNPNVRCNPRTLHQIKCDALSNLNLANCSDKGAIKLRTPNDTLPENITNVLEQWKTSAPTIVDQIIGDKSQAKRDQMIVDYNYSLIGWYLQKYGMKNTLHFIDWLGVPVLPKSGDETWPSLNLSLRSLDNAEAQQKMARLLDGYEYIEQKLDYTFADKTYLLQPFTHETFEANDLTSNYRGMDSVGDAITNYAITRHMFKVQRNLSADSLRGICSILQSNANLGLISMRNKFHKYLRYVNAGLHKDITFFEAYLRRNKFQPVDDVRESFIIIFCTLLDTGLFIFVIFCVFRRFTLWIKSRSLWRCHPLFQAVLKL